MGGHDALYPPFFWHNHKSNPNLKKKLVKGMSFGK